MRYWHTQPCAPRLCIPSCQVPAVSFVKNQVKRHQLVNMDNTQAPSWVEYQGYITGLWCCSSTSTWQVAFFWWGVQNQGNLSEINPSHQLQDHCTWWALAQWLLASFVLPFPAFQCDSLYLTYLSPGRCDQLLSSIWCTCSLPLISCSSLFSNSVLPWGATSSLRQRSCNDNCFLQSNSR